MVKIKNHTSKIICSDSCLIIWYECSIYSCRLESLNDLALALMSYVALILCIDRYTCLLKPFHELWVITREQPNTFAACIITLGMAATYQKLSNTHFDVHVGLVKYTRGRYLLIFDVLTRKTPE